MGNTMSGLPPPPPPPPPSGLSHKQWKGARHTCNNGMCWPHFLITWVLQQCTTHHFGSDNQFAAVSMPAPTPDPSPPSTCTQSSTPGRQGLQALQDQEVECSGHEVLCWECQHPHPPPPSQHTQLFLISFSTPPPSLPPNTPTGCQGCQAL
jgi:hypothetical protein